MLTMIRFGRCCRNDCINLLIVGAVCDIIAGFATVAEEDVPQVPSDEPLAVIGIFLLEVAAEIVTHAS